MMHSVFFQKYFLFDYSACSQSHAENYAVYLNLHKSYFFLYYRVMQTMLNFVLCAEKCNFISVLKQ